MGWWRVCPVEINTDPLFRKCMLHRIRVTEAGGVWETSVGHLKTTGGRHVQLLIIVLFSLLLWVRLQFSIIKVYKTGLSQAFPRELCSAHHPGQGKQLFTKSWWLVCG